MSPNPELSIILPCQNEEKALGLCLKEIKEVVAKNNINAEIIVSDSSTDKSPEIAKAYGVMLHKHDKDGYGMAIMEGVSVSSGKFLLIADADGSYDFKDIPEFLRRLHNGADFVIGWRKRILMQNRAMVWHHKYIGNPILSFILRIFTGTYIRDAHCGIRAIRRDSFDKLNLHTTGMEFASEFVLEAHRQNLRTEEIPVAYNERIGESKLQWARDGWRHLRFMLLYAPIYLFFIPGVFLFVAGSILMIWLLLGNGELGAYNFFVHPLFFASASIIAGYQILFFGLFAQTFSHHHLNHKLEYIEKINKYLTIEKGGVIGIVLTILGISVFAYIIQEWLKFSGGEFNQINNSVLALTLVVLGVQTIFSSFMISLLGIRKR